MDKHIMNLIGDMLNIEIKNEYVFKKICGLTFVARKDITIINDQLSSASMEPVGIIYEENGKSYYAPLHGGEDIDEIVKEYVKRL